MSISNCENSHVAPLNENERTKVAELIYSVGEKEAARRIGLSRHTTVRAVAGMALHPGTRLVVQRWIATQSAAAAVKDGAP